MSVQPISPADEAELDQAAERAWGMDWAPATIALVDDEPISAPTPFPRGVSSGRMELPYRTPREIAAAEPDGTRWVTRGIWAFGAITEVDGKVKAAGKTTFLTQAAAAILDGQPFLGQPTSPARIIYVTEQTPGPFAEALARAGLLDRGDELRLVFRREVGSWPWPEIVARIAEDAQRDGYGVLIFDTLSKLAAIREENDAGSGAAAMTPLQDAAHDGLCVIVARHDRKSGGEVGDSGRGTSAISGDVDIILQLRRPEGHQPGSRRVIESLSRFAETPEKVVIELTDAGYVLLGEEEAVALADGIRTVTALLGSQDPARTLDELVDESGHARTTLQKALRELERRGELRTSGKGVRGDPKRYFLKETDSVLTNGLMGRNEFGRPEGGRP